VSNVSLFKKGGTTSAFSHHPLRTDGSRQGKSRADGPARYAMSKVARNTHEGQTVVAPLPSSTSIVRENDKKLIYIYE
jgi:hypothetical protein